MGKCNIRSLPDLKAGRSNKYEPVYNYDETVISSSLLKYAVNKKYYIKTLGCQANVRDEEIMAGILEKAGFCRVFNIEEADFILFNTCAVRENAETKVFAQIGNCKHLKAKNKDLIVGVCGCMVQQKQIVEHIHKVFPFVDLIFGTHSVENIATLLSEIIDSKQKLIDVKTSPLQIKENLPSARLSKFKAFVNITYGCDKFCTYCIVPYTRGKERSRKKEDILEECINLKNEGYQEVTLLGQNVNAYAKDLKLGYTFATLLDEVASLGIPRIRFLTSHPWDFSDELIDVIAKHDNIMKYIHLPVQSGSDEILNLMGRRYDSIQYKKLVDKIKEKIPGVSISTDIIVGFPNETYEQFIKTVEIADYVRYDSAFTFIYSPRQGTPAANMVDNVEYKEKSRRFKILVDAIEKHMIVKSNEMIGKVYKVLVENVSERNKDMMSGYTEKYKLIHFKGDESLIGKIIYVKIISSSVYSMQGEIVDELDYLLQEIKNEVDSYDVIKNYKIVKDAIEKDEEIIDIQNNISHYQKIMCKNVSNDEIYLDAKAKYDEYELALKNHPLVINFNQLSNEVRDLLLEIKSFLD